jgi:hypothetical protein
MPAESKKQQRFFGMVHAVQKGELSPSEVGPAVRKAARNTDYSDAKDIASTKHKNLPEKVAGILDAIADNKKAILWEAGTTGAIVGGTYAFYKPKKKKKKKMSKKGSLKMKYFEKNAVVVRRNKDGTKKVLYDDQERSITEAQGKTIANRATREGNLIFTAPEYRKRVEKEDYRNPPVSSKYTLPYALKGTGIGAGTGVLAGAGFAALHKMKKLKGIGKAIGIGAAGGAYLGGTLGASIGGQKDFEDEIEMMLTNLDKAEKKYLVPKGITPKVGINHATTYKASPEAIDRYLTNYNRKKIKAERILGE